MVSEALSAALFCTPRKAVTELIQPHKTGGGIGNYRGLLGKWASWEDDRAGREEDESRGSPPGHKWFTCFIAFYIFKTQCKHWIKILPHGWRDLASPPTRFSTSQTEQERLHAVCPRSYCFLAFFPFPWRFCLSFSKADTQRKPGGHGEVVSLWSHQHGTPMAHQKPCFCSLFGCSGSSADQ